MAKTFTGVILGNYRAGKTTIAHAFREAVPTVANDGDVPYYAREELQVTKKLDDANINIKGTPIDFGRMPNTRARMARMREADFFIMVMAHSDVPTDKKSSLSLTYFHSDIERSRKEHCPSVVIGTVEGDLPCTENERISAFAKSIGAEYFVFNKKALKDRKAEELQRLDDIMLKMVAAASLIDTAPLPEKKVAKPAAKPVAAATPAPRAPKSGGIGAWFSNRFSSKPKAAPATPAPTPVADVKKAKPLTETPPAATPAPVASAEPAAPVTVPSLKTDLEDAATLQKAITASLLKNPDSAQNVSVSKVA